MSQSILIGTLMPHPPLLIPEIGNEDTKLVQRTIAAMEKVCREIIQFEPEVVVVISPHGPMFEDAVTIMDGEQLVGDLTDFGVSLTYSFQNDRELAREIAQCGKKNNLPLYLLQEPLKQEYQIKEELDYGAIVPLHFLQQAGYAGKVVLLSPGFVSNERLYQAGMCVCQAITTLGRKAVILASGDNSHALTTDAPAGYTKEGQTFDLLLHKAIENSEWMTLYQLDGGFLEKAAEDTLGSLSILLGAFDRQRVIGNTVSYEGPFGVGYTVATFQVIDEPAPSVLLEMRESREERMRLVRHNESDFVRLARMALETYVREGRMIQLVSLFPEMEKQAGCFVSIKKNGHLRGCIGTTKPTTENIAEEIIQYAIAAGTEDDRFHPVEHDELEDLVYSVDILAPEEEVHDVHQLDPVKYGIIVTDGERHGLLLPNLEDVNTVEEQLRYVKEKAGIVGNTPNLKMYRFEVMRYH